MKQRQIFETQQHLINHRDCCVSGNFYARFYYFCVACSLSCDDSFILAGGVGTKENIGGKTSESRVSASRSAVFHSPAAGRDRGYAFLQLSKE
jgi:hypothetical protein